MTEPNGEQRIMDRTEALLINAARNDAAYALAMARPEVSRADLCSLIRKLATAVQDVAQVAEARGARLNSPAALALETALREALRTH
ncbi:hypothetical protein ACIPMW_15845 [Streptomyces sp. NPDC086669]|uniref:hypothetical protein n=1 Tax=Streptomyces sp. NPDC086669 TaxID=3365753 RepID=UPI0038067FA9